MYVERSRGGAHIGIVNVVVVIRIGVVRGDYSQNFNVNF